MAVSSQKTAQSEDRRHEGHLTEVATGSIHSCQGQQLWDVLHVHLKSRVPLSGKTPVYINTGALQMLSACPSGILSACHERQNQPSASEREKQLRPSHNPFFNRYSTDSRTHFVVPFISFIRAFMDSPDSKHMPCHIYCMKRKGFPGQVFHYNILDHLVRH